MAKTKTNSKVFQATPEGLQAMKVCINNDLAFCIQPSYNQSPNYYICRYKISKFKEVSYLREDVSIPDKESNRLRFNEYDGYSKVFALYEEYSKKFIKK